MEYFGIIESIWSSGESERGTIRVLARLHKGEDGPWEHDRSFQPSELGDTVFLPDSMKLKGLDHGTPVHFEVERNRNWKPGLGLNEYWILWRGGSFDIEKVGVGLVVDEKYAPRWRQRPRLVTVDLPEDVLVYLRQAQDDVLIGPWKTRRADGDLVLEPEKGKECFLFSAMIAEAERVEPADDDGAPAFYLLNRPADDQGKPVDLADGKQLAEWLLELVRESELKQILSELDQRHPRWHKLLLREAFEEREDPVRLELMKDRWQHIVDILQAIRFDSEQLAELVKSPPFKELWARVVEEHRAEIEKQAERDAAPLVRKLRARRETLTAKVEERRAEFKDAEHRLAELEGRASELRDHFEDERQRLLRDFVAYQAVVGTGSAAVVPAPSAHATGPLLEELLVTLPQAPTPAADTADAPEITRRAFVRRLEICVARRHGEVSLEVCALFHAALLGARALLVSHPGWSRAYAEAMGPAARLVSIQVEPHWLRHADFRAAGFAELWRAASEDGDRLYLLHLEDLDRALPELWLRPCLDLLAGFRDRLPEGGTWPKNLRLLASTAPDAASLPLSPFVAGCFAALPLVLNAGPSSPKPNKDEPLLHHVTFARWHAWCQEEAEDELEEAPPQLPPLEPAMLRSGLRPAVEADLRRLAAALRAQGLGPLDVEQRSHQLRVIWPEQYLPQEKEDERFA